MLDLWSFSFPWRVSKALGIVWVSSLLYSWGKLRHRGARCGHILHLTQPGLKPSSIPMRCQGLSQVPGQPCWSQTLLSPKPLSNPIDTTGHCRQLAWEIKYFLLHPAPVAASLFLVSCIPPAERSTVAGSVLVCVYGWTLPLIVNGAIKPFLYIGSGKGSDKPCYLHLRNIHTKGRAFTAFSFTISPHSFRRGNCVRVCVYSQLQRI